MKRFVNDHGAVSLVDSVLPLKEMLPNGVPVYDWSQLRDLVKLQPPDLTGGDGWKQIRLYGMPIPTETQYSFYSMVEPEYDNRSAADGKGLVLPGIDGQGWWASRNWRTKVARFDKTTGKCLWAVGRRAPGKVEPGQMYHPCWLAGVAGGAVFVTDTLGPVWVWNQDGLYMGHLFHEFGSGIEDDQALYGEIQATGVFTDPDTGKIYSVANDTGAHIHEVILPKLTAVTGPAVALTDQQSAKVVAWDPDGNLPDYHPVYTAMYASRTPDISGNFGDFWLGDNMPSVPRAQVLLDGQHLATVEAIYDNQYLYLHYDVTAANGPINSGSELPYAPFVSGAYVDFSVAPNWQGPRAVAREGDVRVLMARIGGLAHGDPFQQGYWQVKAGGTNPQTISSPAATVHFDQIAEVPGLRFSMKVMETDPKTGLTHYVVQAAVPLSSLGLSNPTGKSVGFDASVGVANAAGDRRERAGHWAGLSEAVVVDRPGSTRLLPDTWGTMNFAPPSAPTAPH